MVLVRQFALGYAIVTKMIHRLRGFLIAIAAIALSAGLAFGAQPASTGLANASLHPGTLMKSETIKTRERLCMKRNAVRKRSLRSVGEECERSGRESILCRMCST